MKVSAIIAKTRRHTKASPDDYSDGEILADLNEIRRGMIMFVLLSQGYSNKGYGKFYANLVDHRTVSEGESGFDGEYSTDLSIVKTDRIELKMKSTGDYVEAKIYNENDNEGSEFENLSDNFSASSPKIRMMRDSYIIRPLPTENVIAGICVIAASDKGAYYDTVLDRVMYGDLVENDDFDVILGESFHEIYPRMLAIEYFSTDVKKYLSKIAFHERKIEELKSEINNHYSTQVPSLLKMKHVIHSFK